MQLTCSIIGYTEHLFGYSLYRTGRLFSGQRDRQVLIDCFPTSAKKKFI